MYTSEFLQRGSFVVEYIGERFTMVENLEKINKELELVKPTDREQRRFELDNKTVCTSFRTSF